METDTVVRPATEKDSEQLLDLLTRIDAESEFMLFEAGERRTSGDEHRERVRRICESDNQTILVAEWRQELVGYLLALGGDLHRIRHRAHVVIGVLERFTGRKIGTELLTALETWARHHGIERLELTVRADNARAIALYRKMGFLVEGVRQGALKVHGKLLDEWSMAKMVNQDGLT